MKRSISALLTTLLFSIAIVPNAMAQLYSPNSPADSSTDSPNIPASDSTMPDSMKTEVLPEPSNSPTPSASGINSEKSRPNVDRSISVDSSYPGYCPAIPPGATPGDWQYREALQKCLYGN